MNDDYYMNNFDDNYNELYDEDTDFFSPYNYFVSNSKYLKSTPDYKEFGIIANTPEAPEGILINDFIKRNSWF